MKLKSGLMFLIVMALTASFALSGCGKDKEQTGPVTDLSIFTIATGTPDDQLNGSLTDVIEQETGYTVTYAQAPSSADDAQTAVTNIFVNKLKYDAVKVTKNQMYALIAQGGLADVTEYVNSSDNLKSSISQTGWDLATNESKIYGIPLRNPVVTNNVTLAFRLDLLNKYNTQNPTAQIPVPNDANGHAMTLSNYKIMLDYFVSQGLTSGMVVDKGGVLQESILPAFNIYGEYTDVNGQAVYAVNHPNFQSYMNYMDTLNYRYNVDGAGATNGLSSFKAKTAGAFRVAFWSGASLSTMIDANEVGFIQALVDDRAADSTGKIDKTKIRVQAVDGYSYFTVFPKYRNSENIKAAVDFADKLLEVDTFRKTIIGEENVHYYIDGGAYKPLQPKFDEMNIADKYLIGSRETDYSIYWWARARKNNYNYTLTLVAFEDMTNRGIKNLTAAMPPIDAYNNYQSAAMADSLEKLINAMYGTTDSLETARAAYKAQNGDEITAGVNEWYSNWNGKDNFNLVKPPVFS
jgi:putative aldouronate transport system substrate-binding protein